MIFYPVHSLKVMTLIYKNPLIELRPKNCKIDGPIEAEIVVWKYIGQYFPENVPL